MGHATRAAVIALVAAGCGLDVVGVAPTSLDGGVTVIPDASVAAPDAAPPAVDAGVEQPPPPPPPPGCKCELTAPAGWALVAFANDRTAPCGGDLTSNDLVTDPKAKANACTCGACSFTLPSCEGSWGTRYDTSSTASCNSTSSVTHSTSNGQCRGDNGNLVNGNGRLIPPTPNGQATCTSAGVPAADGATSTPVRVCATSPGGSTCLCDPARAPAYTTCLSQAGDLACPSTAPKKRLVGASAAATCAACGCAATATCSGTATYYTDNDCANAIVTLDEKACRSQNGGGSYSSVKWTGTAVGACTQTPPPGGATLTSPTTICCP